MQMRDRLDRVIAPATRIPARVVAWYRQWREAGYHTDSGAGRTAAMKWLIRGHLLIVVPAATLAVAYVFEQHALEARPVMGAYLTPVQAWYAGALVGLVMSALAPLIALIVLWCVIIAPLAVVTGIAAALQRLIVNATDGQAGRGKAPFAVAGAIVGGVAACAVLVAG